VEGLRHDREFRDGALKSKDMEKPRRRESREAIQRVIPEFLIVHESVERLEKLSDLLLRIRPLQRAVQFLDEFLESKLVILMIRKLPPGRLVEGETWWPGGGPEDRGEIVGEQIDLHASDDSGNCSLWLRIPLASKAFDKRFCDEI
jgi:hypothetical protein